MIVCAVTDLPQPDSPTMASTSPARRSNETPSTARTTPSSVAKETPRSSTVSSGSEISGIEANPGVEVGVGDVHHCREQHDEEGGAQRRAHNGWQVERAHRLGRVLPDALEAEDRFREDRAAADGRAEVQPEERHDRDQRIAQ